MSSLNITTAREDVLLQQAINAKLYEWFQLRDVEKWLAKESRATRYLDSDNWERLVEAGHFTIFPDYNSTKYLRRYVSPRIATDYLKNGTHAHPGQRQQLAPLLHSLIHPAVDAYFGHYNFSKIIVIHCHARGRHGYYAFTFDSTATLRSDPLRPEHVLKLMLSEWRHGRPMGPKCRAFFCDHMKTLIRKAKRQAKLEFKHAS
jgi:hypothetical protein